MMGLKSSEGRNRSSTRTKEALVIQTTISWSSGRLKISQPNRERNREKFIEKQRHCEINS